jgi:hypothetical protein
LILKRKLLRFGERTHSSAILLASPS